MAYVSGNWYSRVTAYDGVCGVLNECNPDSSSINVTVLPNQSVLVIWKEL